MRELARGGITPAEHETALTSLAALSLQRERDLDRIDQARADMAAALAVLDRNPRGIDRLLHRTQVAQAEQAIEDSRTALKNLRGNVIKIDARTTEIQDSLEVRLTEKPSDPDSNNHSTKSEPNSPPTNRPASPTWRWMSSP